MCRRWPTPSIVQSSTRSSDVRRKSATSTHRGCGSVPAPGQDRLGAGGCLLGTDRRRGRQRRTGRARPGGRLSRKTLGDAGEILDVQAKDAYRRRLAEIEDDIDRTIRTGTYCVYLPDPRAPAGWRF